MRVSETIKQNTSLNNMARNASENERLSQNISTGKRILNPSDDPVNSVKGEGRLRELTIGEAVQNNINTQRSELDSIDYTLEEAGELIRQSKVITLEAANGHMTEQAMNASAFEMDKLLTRLFDLANTRVGKVYLFSGTKSLTTPVVLNKTGKISETFHPGDVWRTKHAFIPESNVPTADLLNPDGNMQLFFLDHDKKEYQLNISLQNVRSTEDLTAQINRAFEKFSAERQPDNGWNNAEEQKFFYAQTGADSRIYIQSFQNLKISGIETDIFKNYGTDFEKTEEKNWSSYSGKGDIKTDGHFSLYGEMLEGQPEREYTVKIVQSGVGSNAEYVILNSDRQAITEPQALKDTVMLPTERSKDKPEWQLNFDRNGADTRYYTEGLEFRLYPDRYAVYQGNEDIRQIPLDSGKKIPVTVTAGNLFFKKNEQTVNTFDLLKNVRDAMEANQQERIAAHIDDFDLAIGQVLKARANSGSTAKEIDTAEQRLGDTGLTHSEKYSELTDQDFAKASTDLKKTQLKTEATYDVTSKMLQPGLINFLR